MNLSTKKPRRPFSLSLFWRLFLSLLTMIVLTSTLSIIVERRLNEQELSERMERQIASLLIKREQLAALLSAGDWQQVRQLYRQDRRLMSQVIIYNEQGDIVLPRSRNTGKERLDESKLAIGTQLTQNAAANADTIRDREAQNREGHFLDRLMSARPSYTERASFMELDNRPELAEVQVTLPDELLENETLQSLPMLANTQTVTLQIRPQLLFRDIVELQRGHFTLRLLLIVVFGVLVCFWLSRNMTRRIKRVQDTVHRLIVGDYQTPLALSQLGDDELGVLAKDVSQLSTRLADSERARKQMLSDISHELRSPLARLEVATELTRDFAPEASRYLDRIDKESARMNELIEQIIRIQSLQMQQYSTINEDNLETVDILELLNEIGEDVRFEFQNKPVYWQLSKLNDSNNQNSKDNAEAWSILGRQEQLHSALENVIRNAFIHTAPKSTVKAEICKTVLNNSEAIQISITDEGGGVAEEDLQRIFQPFVRLDSARDRQTGGYGLGLAIVHAVVIAHQGWVEVRNRQDGIKGLIVQIVLPIAYQL